MHAVAAALSVLASALFSPVLSAATITSRSDDPCAKIAGREYVSPSDAMACLTYFPFNETLRQNVMAVVSRVFDFYTFEDYYLEPVPMFQQPAVDIRAELARINITVYDVRGCLCRIIVHRYS